MGLGKMDTHNIAHTTDGPCSPRGCTAPGLLHAQPPKRCSRGDPVVIGAQDNPSVPRGCG